MRIIGLTGGIATGKTTAANALAEMGAKVIDADAISRALSAPGGEAAEAILKAFGTLDRAALGRLVFADEDARHALEAILHPLVRRKMEAEIESAQSPIVVLDVPLLFEAGMEDMADEVWVTTAPRETQIARVMARDGKTRAEAEARIKSQMPASEKLRRADAVIDTSVSKQETRERLRALLFGGCR